MTFRCLSLIQQNKLDGTRSHVDSALCIHPYIVTIAIEEENIKVDVLSKI